MSPRGAANRLVPLMGTFRVAMTAMALAPDATIYPLLLNVSVACFAPVVLKRMTEITCVSAHVPNSVSVDYRSALRIDCPDRVEYGGWGGADGNRSDPAASSAVPICELSNRARSDVVQADTSTARCAPRHTCPQSPRQWPCVSASHCPSLDAKLTGRTLFPHSSHCVSAHPPLLRMYLRRSCGRSCDQYAIPMTRPGSARAAL